MRYDRRTFLFGAAGTLSLAAAAPQPSIAMHAEAKQALATLLEGNARFVADRAACPPLTARRLELAQGQKPFVVVLSCSDSRVPVETIFDQMPGNIFGIRLAGNFVDDHGLGSIEYSVASFSSALILILGHTDCGAVKAAVKYVKEGTSQPSHIQSLVEALAPAVRASKNESGDWFANATRRNVHDNLDTLSERSPIVRDALNAGTLSIAGAIYDLHGGHVTVVT